MTFLVAGIDPSLASTGVALSTGELRRIQSKGSNDATLAQRSTRLDNLIGKILGAVEGADLVVIEGPAFHSKDGHAHDRSGLWWLLVHYLLGAGHEVVDVPPASLKKYLTGKGNAPKDQVLAAAVRRFPDWAVDGNDVADALGLCAMGCDRLAQPLIELPLNQRAALTSVRWPNMPAFMPPGQAVAAAGMPF